MTRTLLQYVLPLLLPTLVFVGWVILTRRGDGAKDISERLASGPWFWLIVGGFAMTAATLVFVALTGGSDPGTTYVAPHMEGDHIVPGQFK